MVIDSWSPGLVVMIGQSCLRGLEFESQHQLLEGYLFTPICCWKRLKVNKKRPFTCKRFYSTILGPQTPRTLQQSEYFTATIVIIT